jgi:hypothetical protein
MSPPTLSSSQAELQHTLLSSSQAELQHTLCFVLQHSDLCHDFKALCSLLSVSTGFASSVHASCAGRSSLTVATDFCSGAYVSGGLVPARPGLVQWLAKHAVLLRHLQHQCCHLGGILQSETQGLAASIGAAAALPEGLKLQSLSTNSMALLTAASSCSSLTQLQLQLDPENLGFGRACNASGGTSSQQALAAVTGVQLTPHKHASPNGCGGGV